MIVLTGADPLLRRAVRQVARPAEEVVWEPARAAQALLDGWPRLHVHGDERPPMVTRPGVPLVPVPPRMRDAWEAERRRQDVPPLRVEDLALRLRVAMADAAPIATWVDRALGDLSRAAGAPLPFAFAAFARHVLEFPRGYTELGDVAAAFGTTRGALKSRFRRRDLESPFLYLRWLRLLAVAETLSDRSVTVSTAAERLGFTSDSNMCRSVRSVAGITPTYLRDAHARHRILLGFAGRYLQAGQRAAWRDLEDVFAGGRRVA